MIPVEVEASIHRREQAEMERASHGCGQGVAGGVCGQRPALLLPRGYRCEQHRPAVTVPDPARALESLREAYRLEVRS